MEKRKKGQRADGLFQCKRKMPDGTTKVFYGHSRTEAEGKYRAALQKGEEKKSEADLFEVAAQEYWSNLKSRVKEGTDGSYRSNWKRCVKAFSGYRMDEITKQMVINFGQSMKNEGLSIGTVHNARSVLNGIFQQWRLRTNSSYNPIQDTKDVGAPSTVREPPTEKELEILREHPEDFGICAWLLMYAGPRIGEAIALQWKDIDFERNRIHISKSVSWATGKAHISTPKTKNAVRDVPLMPQLKSLLADRCGKSDEYVLGGMKRPLEKNEYQREWLAYCSGIGLVVPDERKNEERRRTLKKKADSLPPIMKASITAHQLRHSFATDLYDAGVGVLEAQKIMGHADISTTYKIYTHIRETKLDNAASMLAAFYTDKEK